MTRDVKGTIRWERLLPAAALANFATGALFVAMYVRHPFELQGTPEFFLQGDWPVKLIVGMLVGGLLAIPLPTGLSALALAQLQKANVPWFASAALGPTVSALLIPLYVWSAPSNAIMMLVAIVFGVAANLFSIKVLRPLRQPDAANPLPSTNHPDGLPDWSHQDLRRLDDRGRSQIERFHSHERQRCMGVCRRPEHQVGPARVVVRPPLDRLPAMPARRISLIEQCRRSALGSRLVADHDLARAHPDAQQVGGVVHVEHCKVIRHRERRQRTRQSRRAGAEHPR